MRRKRLLEVIIIIDGEEADIMAKDKKGFALTSISNGNRFWAGPEFGEAVLYPRSTVSLVNERPFSENYTHIRACLGTRIRLYLDLPLMDQELSPRRHGGHYHPRAVNWRDINCEYALLHGRPVNPRLSDPEFPKLLRNSPRIIMEEWSLDFPALV
ncbi:hypothetical protein AVEN_65457-1 [Araneus ventricosus]|uniref:Uncharacterized protein n=1 Tax=Araneus ventricosus TaxID=182803 RepID=A0A4Y2IID5_ARAVE|nr:hypothetical protein AVEN_65457-1 [Araneus ventricosus]